MKVRAVAGEKERKESHKMRKGFKDPLDFLTKQSKTFLRKE
jgi:hypothetical protein